MACVFDPPPSMPITMNVISMLPRAGVGLRACVSEERIPTRRVMVVPISTYQGQAIVDSGASAGASDGYRRR